MDLIKKSKDENVKRLIKPELGFPELQISQVLENVDKICTVEDVSSYVEIWNLKHAFKILEFITEVYGDVCELQQNDFNDDQSQYGFDHELELDEQWDDLLNGDTLFELALENLSLSQLEMSTFDDISGGPQEKSGNYEVPGAALDAFGQLSISE